MPQDVDAYPGGGIKDHCQTHFRRGRWPKKILRELEGSDRDGGSQREDRLSHLTRAEHFYRNIRVSVNLLLSQGHQSARRYPLAMVWYEAQIARERINHLIATEVTLMHSAMVAIMSPKGDGVRSLKKQLKVLRDGN